MRDKASQQPLRDEPNFPERPEFAESASDKPDLSVILCTHNPRPDVLRMVLESLQNQALPFCKWEFIVVDNNSSPHLDIAELSRGPMPPMRLVRERQPGLAAARCCGAKHARADLIVMVDDDNLLDPDYLVNALAIARSAPQIGAFGGKAHPLLERGRIQKWKKNVLPCIGIRDCGSLPITSGKDTWGPWEPIGAGMVVRRKVLEKYVEFLRLVPSAARLGRNGRILLSGDDSLLARCAYRIGYCCSYQPTLQLRHFIKSDRLRTFYLLRVMYGHGRSNVILHRVLGIPGSSMGCLELLARLVYRLFRDRLSGVIWWAWDIGYFAESRVATAGPGQLNRPPLPTPLHEASSVS